jgi:hypothetical protein
MVLIEHSVAPAFLPVWVSQWLDARSLKGVRHAVISLGAVRPSPNGKQQLLLLRL